MSSRELQPGMESRACCLMNQQSRLNSVATVRLKLLNRRQSVPWCEPRVARSASSNESQNSLAAPLARLCSLRGGLRRLDGRLDALVRTDRGDRCILGWRQCAQQNCKGAGDAAGMALLPSAGALSGLRGGLRLPFTRGTATGGRPAASRKLARRRSMSATSSPRSDRRLCTSAAAMRRSATSRSRIHFACAGVVARTGLLMGLHSPSTRRNSTARLWRA